MSSNNYNGLSVQELSDLAQGSPMHRADVRAQVELGLRYTEGQGVPKDEREAVRWYTLAADQGNADAQFFLGWMYAEGKGVKLDYKEAG